MSDPVIEVEGLEKTYRDGTRAVGGVDFQVERGEIFGLLGPNGAGKTTTMRILGTLHHATGGQARILSLEPDRDGDKIRKRIGFAMQEVGMDDLATAREMLQLHGRIQGMGRREARERAAELLAMFDLEDHADRRVTRFSGGMQRRLDLAVSLVHTPELLFLDEPSTGLDPTSRSDLWRILRRLRREEGITILMSTHYMEEADALCDRIAIMADGRIAATGTPEGLKRSVGTDVVQVKTSNALSTRQEMDLQNAFGSRNLETLDHQINIRVRDGGRALLPALENVQRSGVTVVGTKVLTPTLDDVFLHYTGQRLEEDEE